MAENKVIHEVDGIQEEDNKLPRWWLASFYGAILFAVVYWQVYHVFGVGDLPAAQLAADLRQIKKATGAPVDDGVTNELLLAAAGGQAARTGQQLFTENCASCHGAQGEGKIGPNLTDPFWLHGSQPVDIHKSIADGYPLKGMPAWKPVLGAEKTTQLAAFLLTLKGRNVPGKAPEGEKHSSAATPATTILAASK